jgi:hypothetical protein
MLLRGIDLRSPRPATETTLQPEDPAPGHELQSFSPETVPPTHEGPPLSVPPLEYEPGTDIVTHIPLPPSREAS